MSIQAYDAHGSAARAPAAETAQGPFVTIKWQAALAFFLQRFGLNQTVGGVLYPFPISFLAMPAILGWLLAKGWAKPSPTRIVLFCALVVGCCISLLMAQHGGSALSMYMFLAIYALFLFPIVLDDAAYVRFFRLVANMGAIICFIGVAQYAIQFVWKPDFLFSWRDHFDPEYLIEYNTLNMTEWGSGLYKANGFFLLEASWLSQMGARTMLIAVIMLRDPRYVIPCSMAMLASYSGTGLLLFAIFGTLPLLMLMVKGKYLPWAIAGAVGVAVVLAVFSQALNLDLFTKRLTEFDSVDSSASYRFIVVGQAFERFLKEPVLVMLFGAGPAAVDYYLSGLRTDGFAPGWLKIICDYGFFGGLMFCSLLGTCVYQTTRSWVITAAILFQYMVIDGSLVVAQGAIITYFSACAVVRQSTFRPLGRGTVSTPAVPAPA